MRFIGTIEAKADSKGRVFLPASFRRNLQETFADPAEPRLIMRKDIFEDCLVLYTEQEWYNRLDQLKQRLSIWNKTEQAVMRKYVTDAEWISLDSNGRFLIPKRYQAMTGIESRVTFVGMDSTIEIWASEKLEQQNANCDFAQTLQDLMSNEKHAEE